MSKTHTCQKHTKMMGKRITFTAVFVSNLTNPPEGLHKKIFCGARMYCGSQSERLIKWW